MHTTPSNNLRTTPTHVWLGLFGMIAVQVGIILKISWVATWLTPIMWTFYILFVDGLLYRRTGKSWLVTRKIEFPFLALASVGIWLIFEGFNFHLQNWLYESVPEVPWVRLIAYGWSFATILPGVFLSSEFILSYIPEIKSTKPWSRIHKIPDWFWILSGVVMVVVPATLPIPVARYLFGSVWIGFIFMLDPLNRRLGSPSVLTQWKAGSYTLTIALMLGGLLCGLLWEAWNFQAFRLDGGHWIYTVPDPLRVFKLHYGQMPVLGMLGFIPFALELYVMYNLARKALEIDRILGPIDW